MSNLLPQNSRLLHALRPIAAVSLLFFRAAVRSRVVAVLLVVLAAGVIGIPQLVTGDGTPGSEMQVRLRYTLAFGVGILGLATLWTSCAAFGAEIDSRRMELTVVKPVHPLTLWLGRWLGILLLDALLLLGVVAGIRMQLGLSLAKLPGSINPASLLVSRVIARPLLPAPEDEARRRFDELQRANRLPQDISPAAFFHQLIHESRNRYTVLHPGEHASWRFLLPQPVGADGKIWIRMRFDTEAESLADVRGVCNLRRPGEATWAAEVPVNDLVRNEIELAVSVPQLAGVEELELEFVYQAAPKTAALLIQPRRALALLTPQGTFTGNLVRVMLAQLSILAALAAFGLTLGACFSFPVAAFAATALLLVVLVTAGNAQDKLQDVLAADGSPSLMSRVSFAVTRGVTTMTYPLLLPEPLSQAMAGERVPGSELWRMLLWGGLVYPLALALIADRVLRKRELARQGAGG